LKIDVYTEENYDTKYETKNKNRTKDSTKRERVIQSRKRTS